MAGAARAERAIPALTRPVMDEAGLLDAGALATLESELRTYPPLAQIQVWIIPSLDGEPIENLTIRAYDEWKLGNAKDSRGAILLLAVNERAVRIEVGRGLEGDVPDILAARIIRQTFVPWMKANRPATALQATMREIYRAAGGTPLASDPAPRRRSKREPLPMALLVVLFLGVSLLRLVFGIGRSRSSHYGLPGFGGWNRSGGGWSSGGGSWGGGGGSSAGGGASGNW